MYRREFLKAALAGRAYRTSQPRNTVDPAVADNMLRDRQPLLRHMRRNYDGEQSMGSA